LTHVARDLSSARLGAVLGGGLGNMAPEALGPTERDDLVAFLRLGHGDPPPDPAAVAAARAVFDTHCGVCHIEGGLTPLGVPGLADLMARATGDYLKEVVDEGLGWMPAVEVSASTLDSIEAGLRAVAAGGSMAADQRASYDHYCQGCHRFPSVGDGVPAVAAPSLLERVGGRLSPAFVDGLLAGLGTMGPVVAGDGTGAQLRPYLESIAGAAPNADTGLVAGGDGAASRQAFGQLCEGCHQQQGEATVVMPLLARRLELLSWDYVGAFVVDPYGTMPDLGLDAAEQARIQAYYAARHDHQAVPEDARQAYERRCQGCHPAYQDQEPIVVPHLVPTGRRLSTLAVTEISRQGAGAMAPAYTPAGATPSEAEVAATFTHLVDLSGRQGRPLVVPDLNAELVGRGRSVYERQCGSMLCHGAESDYNLAAHTHAGRRYVPLYGLSAELLRQVVRQGRGIEDMPAYGEGLISAADMDALLEYLLHLGQGNAP